jgi:hypothetical protein
MNRSSTSLQEKTAATVSRLECLACGAKYIGEPVICPPACPKCGYNTMGLVEVLSLKDPWWHLRPCVEVP